MEPGTSVGPYRIDREIGVGGMGTVYRALGPQGVVALKVLHAFLLDGGSAVERFQREIEIGKTVRHPNVVQTFDGGESDGLHYLAMEYVEGRTLQQLGRDLDRVPEELCRHVAAEVCKGLAAIHAAGAVHRDVKPENVILTPEHVVKIMDLGVACSMDDAMRLSRTGAFVGSLHYASPEQFENGGKSLDGRVDLHALGLVLYELATGTTLFQADDMRSVIGKVLHEQPRRLGELNPQFSAFFEEVVHCLLAKDRNARFRGADALLAVLDAGEDSAWWRERARALQLATRRPLRRIRIPRETSVYGRDGELAALRGLFDRAAGGDGQVVLVGGEAGIGKSRLVDEFVGRLLQEGEDVDFLFGSYPPGGAATASGAFSTAYREHFGQGGSAPFLPDNALLVPAFDALLRGDATPKGNEPLTKDSLQTCFVRATQALAARRTTIVLIDDLHFAPDEGRALFSSLAMATAGHRVLLIGTARPGVPEGWVSGLTRLDHAARIDLQRLGAKDLVHLLRESFGSDRLAEQLGVQIALKSDGNPFFAFEIVRGLREGQFITQSPDGSWVSTRRIEEITIPASVLDLVNARVSGLADDERNLLDVASCCGYEFDASLVGEAMGLTRLLVLQAMAKIEKRDRLVRASGRRFVFDHHQVQEALYGALPEMLREEYHASIAAALEARAGGGAADPATLDGALCVDICDHSLRGGRSTAALRYLAAAQSHLRKAYLHQQMVALTERALAVPGLLAGDARIRTLLALADALDSAGRPARQEEVAREAGRLAESSEDRGLQGAAASALGLVLLRTSRNAEAEAAYRRALEIAVAAGDRKAEAHALGKLGNVFNYLSRHAEAEELYVQFLAVSVETGDRQGEADAAGNLGGLLSAMGRLREARENLGRQLELSRELGDRDGEAIALGNLGIVCQLEGRLPEARELLERQRALSCEIGDRPGEVHALGNLGLVAGSEGRAAEARRCYERQLAISREIGYRLAEVYALHNLAYEVSEAGDAARAEELHAACLALCKEVECPPIAAASHLDRGRERAAAGDVDGARAAFDASLAITLEHRLGAQETLARCRLALLPGGDAAAAVAAFAAHGDRLSSGQRRDVHLMLYQATGRRAYLDEAKRLLDESLAGLDDETRARMLAHVRVSREVTAAWESAGGAAS